MKNDQNRQVQVLIEKGSELETFYLQEKEEYRQRSLAALFEQILIARKNIIEGKGTAIDHAYWPQFSLEHKREIPLKEQTLIKPQNHKKVEVENNNDDDLLSGLGGPDEDEE